MAITIRPAVAADVSSIRAFGEAHIRPHYAPLIVADAAAAPVKSWWSHGAVAGAVAEGLVVVGESAGEVVGVAQRGRYGREHVIYKLYVAPDRRGAGLGPLLLEALVTQLPEGTDRVFVEHVAANVRAGAFYEREGFVVQRVELSPAGDPARDQIWRVRTIDTRLGQAGMSARQA